MKNWINKKLVETMASEITIIFPEFRYKDFQKLTPKLNDLELKARVLLVTEGLSKFLPSDYPRSISIITEVIKRGRLKGFDLWPFSEYIGQFGLNHFDLSLQAMHILTQKFTAEFAIRPFLLKDSAFVLKFMDKCATDANHHVRRWASEGTRPLLPWGQRIPQFVADPTPTLKLLEKLKYDEELYVRKSVANHLNDISKNHPQLLIDTLSRWEKECPINHKEKIIWIMRQALRTLIKRGHPGALKLMGVGKEAQVTLSKIKLENSKLKIGDKLTFECTLTSTAKKNQKLVVDYLINFMKSNGVLSAKVFKLKTFELAAGDKITIRKTHSMRKITTMVYYPGKHEVMLQINGKVLAKASWNLS